MELGNVSAGWLGLLALPIIMLYLLRVRPRRRAVSTILFWNQALQQRKPRAFWQRMRHPFSLLAQLLLLGLLLAALIDPALPGSQRPPERLVLIVDQSASMQATDVAPSRLEQARREAYRLVRGLQPNDQMALITAGGSARVRCGLTSHQPTLRQALRGLRSSDGPTSVLEAVRLASRLLDQHPRGRIVVLTDGCLPDGKTGESPDSPRNLGGQDHVQWRLIGGPADNVGITRFQVRRGLTDPLSYEVLVEVGNFGRAPARLRLELDRGDKPVDVHVLNLSPEERWSRSLEHLSADGGVLRARLRRPPDEMAGAASEAAEPDARRWRDALAADDQALAVLPPLRPQAVLLVTPGNLFLQRVLQAMPRVDLQVTDKPPDRLPANTVAVYHAVTPTTIPAGNVLVIDPMESSDLWEVGPMLEQPLVTRQPSDSPLMRHVALDSEHIRLPRVRQLRLRPAHDTLVAALSGDPLYVSVRRPAGKLLVMNFNLADGDLPLRTAFPILMGNALRWFRGPEERLVEAVAAGGTVELELRELPQTVAAATGEVAGGAAGSQTGAEAGGPSAATLRLRSPSGRVFDVPDGRERAVLGPFDECGLWTVEPANARPAAQDVGSVPNGRTSGDTEQVLLTLACNLASARESDLRPMALHSAPAGVESPRRGGRPLWFTLTLLACALLVGEWFLYQRRWLD